MCVPYYNTRLTINSLRFPSFLWRSQFEMQGIDEFDECFAFFDREKVLGCERGRVEEGYVTYITGKSWNPTKTEEAGTRTSINNI